uniref:Wsv045-like protein n=1 Tax=Pasiphaea japonica whispovirus TaxID=2984286 RepID=A0A9C7F8L3_9VIRU|nr:MAG: wsv045-like protein [Pasiphaea japonica whispovirus]
MNDKIINEINNKTIRVKFNVKTDDKCGVSQMTVLMMAIDSFVSILASHEDANVTSSKQENTFCVKIPYNVPSENLFNNIGFPAGLCGPFKRWSINFKASALSGKSGIAGLVGSILSGVKNSNEKKGTDILDMVNRVSSSVQRLDDSEMATTLNHNKRLCIGTNFTITNSRQVNQRNLLRRQQSLDDKLQNIEDTNQYYNEQVEDEQEDNTYDDDNNNEEEEDEKNCCENKKQKINCQKDEDNNDMDERGIVFENTSSKKRKRKGKKNSSKKRSRRKGECSVNTLSFVEKYVGSCKSLGLKSTGCPPPSKEFTSLFMKGSEVDACYQTCQAMRGASRIRSLLNKYSNKELMKETEDKKGWTWVSPKDRRLVLVDTDSGEEVDVVFEVNCEKSKWFNHVTNTALNIKQWLRDTAQIIGNLRSLEKFLPQMGSSTPLIEINMLKTLAGLFSVRDTIGFKIPEHSQNILPKEWKIPISCMGIVSQRYDRIIEVMDLLITGGAFVTSCLNNAYFFEKGVVPKKYNLKNTWLHVDIMQLSTTIFRQVLNRTDKGYYYSTSGSKIVVCKDGISVKAVPGKSRIQFHDLSIVENNHKKLPPQQHDNQQQQQQQQPTRQSIDLAISSIINNYTDVSSKLRKRGIQNFLSDRGKASLDEMISKVGAFKALLECTVVTCIKNSKFSPNKLNNNQRYKSPLYSPSTATSSLRGAQSCNTERKVLFQSFEGENSDVEEDDDEKVKFRKNTSKTKNQNNNIEIYNDNYDEDDENNNSSFRDSCIVGFSSDDILKQRADYIRKTAALAALALTHHSLGSAMVTSNQNSDTLDPSSINGIKL